MLVVVLFFFPVIYFSCLRATCHVCAVLCWLFVVVVSVSVMLSKDQEVIYIIKHVHLRSWISVYLCVDIAVHCVYVHSLVFM